MKTPHLVAWLTCLALAFFACVLSVKNTGSILSVEEEVERLRESGQGQNTRDTRRIIKSLKRVEEEIKALKESEITEDASGIEEKLDRLESKIKTIKRDLATEQ